MVTSQVNKVARLLHAPPQPVNAELLSGSAVNLTTALVAKLTEQTGPQVMPVGLLFTAPVPVPVLVTLNKGPLITSNSASATCAAPVIVIGQIGCAPLLAHAPDHPLNLEFAEGVAVSSMPFPVEKLKEHCEPQLIPDWSELTEPKPVPLLVTVIDNTDWKVAVTKRCSVIFTVHTGDKPELEQAPPQPKKLSSLDGVACRVTVTFS